MNELSYPRSSRRLCHGRGGSTIHLEEFPSIVGMQGFAGLSGGMYDNIAAIDCRS